MSWLVPARRHDPEWLDRPGNDPADLRSALEDIARVNRFLGGSAALLGALGPFLDAAEGRAISVLDVGAGGGDLPVVIANDARRRGVACRVVALDLDPVTAATAAAAAAAHPEIRVVRGDAFALPFPTASFDLVVASLFLHHFDHDAAVRLVRGFRRVARRAVVVNDLMRHRLPWAFIALAARATRRHPMFVHDAPLSVLRGFTAGELLRIAREAGAGEARVRTTSLFRLVLTLPGEGARP